MTQNGSLSAAALSGIVGALLMGSLTIGAVSMATTDTVIPLADESTDYAEEATGSEDAVIGEPVDNPDLQGLNSEELAREQMQGLVVWNMLAASNCNLLATTETFTTVIDEEEVEEDDNYADLEPEHKPFWYGYMHRDFLISYLPRGEPEDYSRLEAFTGMDEELREDDDGNYRYKPSGGHEFEFHRNLWEENDDDEIVIARLLSEDEVEEIEGELEDRVDADNSGNLALDTMSSFAGFIASSWDDIFSAIGSGLGYLNPSGSDDPDYDWDHKFITLGSDNPSNFNIRYVSPESGSADGPVADWDGMDFEPLMMRWNTEAGAGRNAYVGRFNSFQPLANSSHDTRCAGVPNYVQQFVEDASIEAVDAAENMLELAQEQTKRAFGGLVSLAGGLLVGGGVVVVGCAASLGFGCVAAGALAGAGTFISSQALGLGEMLIDAVLITSVALPGAFEVNMASQTGFDMEGREGRDSFYVNETFYMGEVDESLDDPFSSTGVDHLNKPLFGMSYNLPEEYHREAVGFWRASRFSYLLPSGLEPAQLSNDGEDPTDKLYMRIHPGEYTIRGSFVEHEYDVDFSDRFDYEYTVFTQGQQEIEHDKQRNVVAEVDNANNVVRVPSDEFEVDISGTRFSDKQSITDNLNDMGIEDEDYEVTDDVYEIELGAVDNDRISSGTAQSLASVWDVDDRGEIGRHMLYAYRPEMRNVPVVAEREIDREDLELGGPTGDRSIVMLRNFLSGTKFLMCEGADGFVQSNAGHMDNEGEASSEFGQVEDQVYPTVEVYSDPKGCFSTETGLDILDQHSFDDLQCESFEDVRSGEPIDLFDRETVGTGNHTAGVTCGGEADTVEVGNYGEVDYHYPEIAGEGCDTKSYDITTHGENDEFEEGGLFDWFSEDDGIVLEREDSDRWEYDESQFETEGIESDRVDIEEFEIAYEDEESPQVFKMSFNLVEEGSVEPVDVVIGETGEGFTMRIDDDGELDTEDLRPTVSDIEGFNVVELDAREAEIYFNRPRDSHPQDVISISDSGAERVEDITVRPIEGDEMEQYDLDSDIDQELSEEMNIRHIRERGEPEICRED